MNQSSQGRFVWLAVGLFVGSAGFWFLLPSPKEGKRAGVWPERSVGPDPQADSSGRALPANLNSEGAGAELAGRGPGGGVQVRTTRVIGTIVDPTRAPVPGAEVEVFEEIGTLSGEVHGETPEGDGLRRSSTGVDEEGAFQFEALEGDWITLRVHAPGFMELVREDIALGDGGVLDLGLLRLERVAKLAGKVVNELGFGVPGARLVALDPFGGGKPGQPGNVLHPAGIEPLVITDREGYFETDALLAGHWSLRVDSVEHPPIHFEGLLESGQTQEVTLVLPYGATIQGFANGVPGDVRNDLDVIALGPDPVRPNVDRRRAALNRDGSFLLEGLVPGNDYSLFLERRHGAGEDFGTDPLSETITASAGAENVMLVFRPEARLEFRVVDGHTRLPMVRFRVRAGIDELQPELDADGLVRIVHPEGKVLFEHLRPRQVGDRCLLEVEAPAYRFQPRDPIAISPGDRVDLGDIVLEPLQSITVNVRDAESGSAVPGALVSLVISDMEHPPPPRLAVTDNGGWAKLEAFQGHRASVGAKALGFASSTNIEVSFLRGEDIRRTLELRAGGEVVIHAVRPNGAPARGLVVLRRGFVPDYERAFVQTEARTDSRGRARFAHLNPGCPQFVVLTDGEDGTWKQGFVARGGSVSPRSLFLSLSPEVRDNWHRVTVREGERVDLEIEVPAAASAFGRILEEGRPLPYASVRLGWPRDSEQSRILERLPVLADAEGRYRLDGLPQGSYDLVVAHPSRALEARSRIDLTPGENEFDVFLDGAGVEGRVIDAAGEPLAGVLVRLSTYDDFRTHGAPGLGGSARVGGLRGDLRGGGAVSKPGITDAAGRYRLRGVPPETACVVFVDAEGIDARPSAPFQVKPGALRKGVDLEVQDSCALSVRLIDSAGLPVARATLNLRNISARLPSSSRSRSTDEGGLVRFIDLSPGRWILSLQQPQWRGLGSVELTSGETRSMSIEIPKNP